MLKIFCQKAHFGGFFWCFTEVSVLTFVLMYAIIKVLSNNTHERTDNMSKQEIYRYFSKKHMDNTKLRIKFDLIDKGEYWD